MSDTEFNHRWDERWAVLWRVWISHSYHRKRERFFDGFDRIFKALAVIGGSAALAKIGEVPAFKNFGGPNAIAWIAFFITVTSTSSLVFSFSEKARRHGDLASQFKKLEADIHRVGDGDFTSADLASWKAKLAELEATEPATLYALTQLCELELNIANGHSERGPRVGVVKKAFAHLWRRTTPF